MAQPKKESFIQRFSTGTKPKVEKGDTLRIWRKTGECLSGIYLFVISCHLNLLFFRQVPEALQDEGQYIVEETKTESKLETLRRTIGEGFDNAMDSIPKLIPKVKEAFVTMETQMSDPDTIDRLANDAAQQVIRPSLRHQSTVPWSVRSPTERSLWRHHFLLICRRVHARELALAWQMWNTLKKNLDMS